MLRFGGSIAFYVQVLNVICCGLCKLSHKVFFWLPRHDLPFPQPSYWVSSSENSTNKSSPASCSASPTEFMWPTTSSSSSSWWTTSSPLSASTCSACPWPRLSVRSPLVILTVTHESHGACPGTVFDKFGDYAVGYYSLGAINFLAAAILLSIPLTDIFKEKSQLKTKIYNFVDFHLISIFARRNSDRRIQN